MSLDVNRMPLRLDDSDLETVAKGMVNIFPSLTSFEGFERGWDEISGKIEDLQKVLKYDASRFPLMVYISLTGH